jgi:hypothetical protein
LRQIQRRRHREPKAWRSRAARSEQAALDCFAFGFAMTTIQNPTAAIATRSLKPD